MLRVRVNAIVFVRLYVAKHSWIQGAFFLSEVVFATVADALWYALLHKKVLFPPYKYRHTNSYKFIIKSFEVPIHLRALCQHIFFENVVPYILIFVCVSVHLLDMCPCMPFVCMCVCVCILYAIHERKLKLPASFLLFGIWDNLLLLIVFFDGHGFSLRL